MKKRIILFIFVLVSLSIFIFFKYNDCEGKYSDCYLKKLKKESDAWGYNRLGDFLDNYDTRCQVDFLEILREINEKQRCNSTSDCIMYDMECFLCPTPISNNTNNKILRNTQAVKRCIKNNGCDSSPQCIWDNNFKCIKGLCTVKNN